MSFDKEDMRTLLLSKLVPRSIICKFPDVLYRGKLCNNSFLRCCSDVGIVPPRLPCLLAIHLMPAEYMSGELVFQLHDFAYNLGLVLRGTFAFVGQPSSDGGADTMPPKMMDEDTTPGLATPHSSHIINTRPLVTPQWFRASARPSLKETPCLRRSSTEMSVHSLSPYMLCGSKSYFGDMECITGSMRLATLRCERSGTTLLLRKNDFFELVDEFPQFGQVWASAAWRRDSHRRTALKRLTAPHTFRTFAATTIQMAFRTFRNRAWTPAQQIRSTLVRHAVVKDHSAPNIQTRSKQYNHRDLKEMTAPAPSNSFVLREVEKLQHAVGGIQSEMKQMRQMLQVLVPEKTAHI